MKMKRTYYYLIFILSAVLPAGCITTYEHPGLKEIDNILVVQGMITDGTSSIKLSRSIDLTDGTFNPKVNNATVSVVCDDGTVFPSSGTVIDGTYNIDVNLEADKKYCVRIVASGLEYESDFRYPQTTPEIDEIDYYKAALGEPIEMRVSATGREGDSRFFLWSFEEIWEFVAPIPATVYQYAVGKYEQVEVYPYYYCWQYGNSSGLLLGTSAKQQENILKNYTIKEFDPVGDRFKILYWVKLKQNMLSNEAYEYFSTLKKNSESTGGIFAPIISEMKGNVTCKDDPEVKVIGFVEVSYTTTAETFVDPSSRLAEYAPQTCKTYASLDEAAADRIEPEHLTVYYIDPWPTPGSPPDSLRALTKCVDCRLMGGSKTKPDFWPNLHE